VVYVGAGLTEHASLVGAGGEEVVVVVSFLEEGTVSFLEERKEQPPLVPLAGEKVEGSDHGFSTMPVLLFFEERRKKTSSLS
jgi:hypothetical protein